MSDEVRPTTEDSIDFLKIDGVDTLELTRWLEEKRAENIRKVYVSFNVKIIKDDRHGMGLLFSGVREETPQETKDREAKEQASRKAVEEAELKEFLRLKKIYGKKDE